MSDVKFVDRRHSAKPRDPILYRREPPVSAATLAEWQRQLEQAVPVTDRLSRLLIRWEPGDAWQPIQRFMLWQCVDPRHHEIEPWILAELRGPAPRSTGHICWEGYCLCDLKKHRWVQGACRYIDQGTWELYQETKLYGSRWWVIQGERGGHRKQWEVGGLESTVAQSRGHPAQPPLAGDLPYAPFDQRVFAPVLAEQRARHYMGVLASARERAALLTLEEQAEREQIARQLWDDVGTGVDAIWDEGVDLLPRYFEEQYGRVPTGTRPMIDPERVDEQFLSGG